VKRAMAIRSACPCPVWFSRAGKYRPASITGASTVYPSSLVENVGARMRNP
jgi:hypothetical protein